MTTTETFDHIADGDETSRSVSFLHILKTSCKAHAPLAVLVGMLALADLILVGTLSGRIDILALAGSFILLFTTLPAFLLAVVVMRAVNLVVHVKPKHPVPALLKDLRDVFCDPRRIANGLPILLLFFAFTNIFAHIKANIPVIVPFSWDVYFMEMDRWLHFGFHPWELLQPLLGYAPVTWLINFVYNLWFVVVWIIWVWFGFGQQPSVLRTRFLISFFLIWAIGGNLMAIIFSSAGPAFYMLLNLGTVPFGPLMTYLQNVNQSYPLWALDTQNMLWAAYKHAADGSGISAMPSMHNATVFLFALVGWRISRFYGWSLSVFAFLIFLGSIHLAWHYAVDAYLAFALTYVIWRAAEPFAQWWENHRWSRDYQALHAQHDPSNGPT